MAQGGGGVTAGYVFAAIEPLHQHSAAALRQNFHFPRRGLAVKREKNDFLAIAITYRAGRHKDALRLRAYLLAFVRQEFDGSVHVRPQVGVRGKNLHFHLHCGFGPVGLGRHFSDHAVILAVGKGIGCDHAFLFGVSRAKSSCAISSSTWRSLRSARETTRPLRPAFGGAGESRGHEFAFFRRPLKNRSRHRSANHGRVEQRFRVVRLSLGLLQGAAGARNFFLAADQSWPTGNPFPVNSPAAGRLRTSQWHHRALVSTARLR